jgi:hypothetical protein
LGIDVPIDLPEFGGDLIKETSVFHGVTELGFEEDGEGLDGEIEIDPGGVPEAIGGGEGAAGDDVMDMGVELQGTAPGVKDAEETREIAADVVLIEGKLLDCFGRSFKEGRVSDALVFANEAAQTLGDGEGDQEMVAGELAFELLIEPLLALMVLTGGAMAISAGTIEAMELATCFALIENHSRGLGATGDHGIDDLAMCFRDGLGVALEVLGTKGSEDLIDGGHSLGPPLPD